MVVDSIEPFLRKAEKEGKSLGEVMIEHEAMIQEVEEEVVIDAMKKIWEVMKDSIEEGIEITEPSPSGMSGGNAQKLLTFAQENDLLAGSIIAKATARAIAVGEYNSSFGVIVAAPTAGSSGVLPAVIYTTAETLQADEEAIIRGLFASSLIGLVCDAKASTSGSEHGCQAEIGVSAGMAAAAAVEIAGGTPNQAINAAAIVLKNMLGLACDPVAGLVEVPCIKRNGIAAAQALIAADMARANIKSVIPFDEVVLAMDEIGRMLPRAIKETSQGGLATTPTGRKYKNWLRKSKTQLEEEF
ncbi:MAG: L-serine ammonia-lyase, iron-sulfur-dependent, subunit alpha [Candidatus Heimdallarchaeota archaeon]|nr:L-serine ammonia-lyase, iron-sulfur-dependent, subunit alpha [Candidatus Heimdallarchaeota archaeon]